MSEEIAQKAWDISPTSVYGFLVLLLLGTIIYIYLEKKKERKEYIKSLNDFNESIKNMNKSMTDTMADHRTTVDKFIELIKDTLRK